MPGCPHILPSVWSEDAEFTDILILNKDAKGFVAKVHADVGAVPAGNGAGCLSGAG